MAKKSLGYVELEWTCPTCNTRNPGTKRTCQGCGAPMPPDVKFEAPGATKILDHTEAGEAATKAPDIHCPYCDARNPAGATVCKQCGGDLTQGQARQAGDVVAGFTTAKKPPVKCTACGQENPAEARTCANCGAPLPAAKPVAAKAKPEPSSSGGRGCLIAFAAMALVVVVGLGWLFYQGSQRSSTVARVAAAEWTRTVEVEGLLPRRYSAWFDEIPGDATLGQCNEEVRETVSEPVDGAREVCGTPYAVDLGTGLARVEQDCEYQILARWCDYTVNEWQTVREEVVNGTGFNPFWPESTLAGRERPGGRSETFTCVFTAGDQTYRYRVASFEDYQLCTPGSTWNLEVSGSGRVVSAALAE